MLTQEYVQSRYDYAGGFLIAKFNKGKTKVGDVVGYAGCKDGYLRISVRDKPINLHRVVFLWHRGYLPPMVDHIDGNILNNSIENLRESNALLNGRNKQKHRDGIPPGVSWHNRDKCWQAYKYESGKRINLGYHDTLAEAEVAVRIA